jgi:hypothetical protein
MGEEQPVHAADSLDADAGTSIRQKPAKRIKMINKSGHKNALDMVGVASSNLAAPTISKLNFCSCPTMTCNLERDGICRVWGWDPYANLRERTQNTAHASAINPPSEF